MGDDGLFLATIIHSEMGLILVIYGKIQAQRGSTWKKRLVVLRQACVTWHEDIKPQGRAMRHRANELAMLK